MNIASDLIKNVQHSPIKGIDPKLNDSESVPRLIRHNRAKRLTAVCDGVELDSDICSLKTLVDKIFIKDAMRAQMHCMSVGAPLCIDWFKTFCIVKAFVCSSGPSNVQ